MNKKEAYRTPNDLDQKNNNNKNPCHHILIKAPNAQKKGILKAVRENGQVIYKAKSIRITHNFSPETMKGENLGLKSYRM